MYSFTNLMAAIYVFTMIPGEPANPPQEATGEQNEYQTSGYVVLESIDDKIATIETENGTFDIPRNLLPSNMNEEGMVIEWHISEAERDRRLAQAKSRIQRMKEISK